MKSIEGKSANYQTTAGYGFTGNPLIEALPKPPTTEGLINKIQNYPPYNKNERFLAPESKIHLLGQISRVFVPLPITLSIARNIEIAIRNGYVERNPLSSEVTRFYNDNYNYNNRNQQHNYSFAAKTVSNMYIVGSSGVGKSTNVSRILSALYEDQVIQHVEYKNASFIFQQIVYIKVSVPWDGSVKGILYNIFSEVDRVAQTNFYSKVTKSRATVDEMLNVFKNVSFNIGVLIVDEIQNVNMQKSSGAERVMNFFTNLSNLGLPIILVGTAKSLSLIKLDFKQARRSIGIGGNMLMDRLHNNEMWHILIKGIWKYQYTIDEIELNDEFLNLLYDLTQGIPDLLAKLYQSAQLHCIMYNQKFTTKVINKVFKEQFVAVHPVIRALKSNNIQEIAKYEDILVDLDFLTSRNMNDLVKIRTDVKKHSDIIKSNPIPEVNNKTNLKIRVKSPESSNDLRTIVYSESSNSNSVYEKLLSAGIIYSFNYKRGCL